MVILTIKTTTCVHHFHSQNTLAISNKAGASQGLCPYRSICRDAIGLRMYLSGWQEMENFHWRLNFKLSLFFCYLIQFNNSFRSENYIEITSSHWRFDKNIQNKRIENSILFYLVLKCKNALFHIRIMNLSYQNKKNVNWQKKYEFS